METTLALRAHPRGAQRRVGSTQVLGRWLLESCPLCRDTFLLFKLQTMLT
jgi:hypothetical protein